MIHTGSRDVGFMLVDVGWIMQNQSIQKAFHPESGIYALEDADAREYMKEQGCSCQLCGANRLAIAELVRQRCVQVFGERAFNLL